MQCIFTRLLEFKVESFTLNQSTLQSQSCNGEMFACLAKCRETKSRGVYKVSCFVVLVVHEGSNLAKVCLQKKVLKVTN